MSVSIASMRDTAKTLAIRPDAVAMIASATVNHRPYSPSAGRAASASEKSLARMIAERLRLAPTAKATRV